MTEKHFKAIIVDDDPITRLLVTFALRQAGFICDAAEDGTTALQMIVTGSYDLVVTDLCIPHKNGHALAKELLRGQYVPFIVVHTSIEDPRITEDLMLRGVDDIVHKPTNYAAFAAKLKGLVARGKTFRATPQSNAPIGAFSPFASGRPDPNRGVAPHLDDQDGGGEFPVRLADIERQIARVSRVLPLSQVAQDVFKMTRSASCSARKLSAIIQRDPSFAAEILTLANARTHYAQGEAIARLDLAVVRLGQRRIGELALATGILSAATPRQLPWLNVRSLWRQCVTAGAAVARLAAARGDDEIADSLLLIAIMHGLGRVVLGTMYPRHYVRMVNQCREDGSSLLEQEKHVFPESHARIMARLLELWHIPRELHQPLSYLLDSYSSLALLSEPMRTHVELVKLAVFIGQVAAGSWHSWDQVEFPPVGLLERLRIHDVAQILEQARNDTEVLIASGEKTESGQPGALCEPRAAIPTHKFHYVNVSPLPFDFLSELTRNMGLHPIPVLAESLKADDRALINCVGAKVARQTVATWAGTGARLAIVAGPDWPDSLEFRSVLRTPISYGRLEACCAATAAVSAVPLAHSPA